MSHLLRTNAPSQLLIFAVILAGVDASAKTPQATQYREIVMRTFLQHLFAGNESVSLPDHYFAVYNPFNNSHTQFRFNLSDGLLVLRGLLVRKADINVCVFKRGVSSSVICTLPIPGSYAVYDASLSYGSKISENFTVLVDTKPYEGWNNPADISAHFHFRNHRENASLVLTHLAVTEFEALITSIPPFENFAVFQKNETLIEFVWLNFTDYVFRKCKQDMRDVLKDIFIERMQRAAEAVGIVNSELLLSAAN